MTTSAIVGVYTNSEHTDWRAVEIGADGYPSGVGWSVYFNYHYTFRQDLPALVDRLLRPGGWYAIAGKNLQLPALTWEADYHSVMDARWKFHEVELNEHQRRPAVATTALEIFNLLGSIPVAHYSVVGHESEIITPRHKSYRAEWSYLIDVPRAQMHVYFGHPSIYNPCEIVDLSSMLDEGWFDSLWSSLPDKDKEEE